MKTNQFLLLLFFMFSIMSCARTQKTTSNNSEIVKLDLNLDIKQVEVDNVQNIYILTGDNKILRYDSELNKKYEYSNDLNGSIKSIDVVNPQKILCFIHDFNRILVLDNTLAEINTIDLSTTEFYDISAIARSNDNRIWIFDPISQTLVKIDELRKPLYRSNRMSDFGFSSLEAFLLREKNNRVALVDEEQGILIFDNFGQFLKLLPEKDIDAIQIFGDYVFYSQYGSFFQYHINRYEKLQLDSSPNPDLDKMLITRDYIYFYGTTGLWRTKNN